MTYAAQDYSSPPYSFPIHGSLKHALVLTVFNSSSQPSFEPANPEG